jgi:NAD(P)H dehydrogenase (quinone)
MKNLVVYCHPDPKSFCHAILENVVDTLRGKGHEVRIKDLYADGFDPVLKGGDFAAFQAGKTPADIKAEQDLILWAETITVIHPVWWTSLPAMLKGYIDRVFALGFAYAFGPEGPKGLLGGRKAIIFSTQGADKNDYDTRGMTDAMKKTSDVAIFSMCNMEVLEHKFFGGVPSVDDAARKRYLTEVKEVMSHL